MEEWEGRREGWRERVTEGIGGRDGRRNGRMEGRKEGRRDEREGVTGSAESTIVMRGMCIGKCMKKFEVVRAGGSRVSACACVWKWKKNTSRYDGESAKEEI